jgi:hypothetical protein
MSAAPWRPTRKTTVIIGVATLWPLLYMALFLGFIAYTFLSFGRSDRTATAVPALFTCVFVLHLLTMVLMFALVTVYIVHAFRTDLVAEDRRVLWVVVLLFGAVVAGPIYWYLYMWKPLEMPGALPRGA